MNICVLYNKMCKIKLFWEKMFNYLMYKKSRSQVLSSLVSLGYTGYDVQKLCNYDRLQIYLIN